MGPLNVIPFVQVDPQVQMAAWLPRVLYSLRNIVRVWRWRRSPEVVPGRLT